MIARFFIWLVRLYQKHLSPHLGAHCRYYPTCSQYAIDPFREWGAFIGFFLAFFRILRCNPFSRGGVDYVPKRKRLRSVRINKKENQDAE